MPACSKSTRARRNREDIKAKKERKKEQKQRRENQRKLELEKCQPDIKQSIYEKLKRTRQINFEIRNLDNNKIVKSHERVSFGVSENPHGNDWDYD